MDELTYTVYEHSGGNRNTKEGWIRREYDGYESDYADSNAYSYQRFWITEDEFESLPETSEED